MYLSFYCDCDKGLLMKLKKLLKFALYIFIFDLFFSCSNGSSSSDNEQKDMIPDAEEYLLQWDNAENAFVGTVTWKANTTEEKVLLGYEGNFWGSDFVDSVVWEAIIPYDYEWSNDFAHLGVNSNYAISSSTCSLTSTVRAISGL